MEKSRKDTWESVCWVYLETNTQIGHLSPLTEFGEAPVEKMEVHARIAGAEVTEDILQKEGTATVQDLHVRSRDNVDPLLADIYTPEHISV